MDGKGRKKIEEKHFTWVTDLHLDKKTVFKVMRGARCRWKIENETFNTLKNGGYEFEHNFGHGDNNLSINAAILMFIQFLIDQILEMGNEFFQKVLKFYRKSYLWEFVRALYQVFNFGSWESIWQFLLKKKEASFNTS